MLFLSRHQQLLQSQTYRLRPERRGQFTLCKLQINKKDMTPGSCHLLQLFDNWIYIFCFNIFNKCCSKTFIQEELRSRMRVQQLQIKRHLSACRLCRMHAQEAYCTSKSLWLFKIKIMEQLKTTSLKTSNSPVLGGHKALLWNHVLSQRCDSSSTDPSVRACTSVGGMCCCPWRVTSLYTGDELRAEPKPARSLLHHEPKKPDGSPCRVCCLFGNAERVVHDAVVQHELLFFS